MTTTIIRLPEVKKQTGLSRSTIYDFIAKGQFPRQVELGVHAVGWVEADIQGWIASRINRRNAA